MLNLADLPRDFLDDPFPYYRTLCCDVPVCVQADGSVLVSRHADLERIYKDTERFLSDKRETFGPKFGVGAPLYEHHTTSLVFNDPPLHTRVRRIVSGALTPRAIGRLEAGLTGVVDDLLVRMGTQVDLIADFASAIPVQIIGDLLDVPLADRGALRDWSLAILGALEPVVSDAEQARGDQAVVDFKAYLTGLVADRRARPGAPETDVLTRLILGDALGELNELELLHNCIFILNAGHETTTNLIGNGLALIHDLPDVRAQLVDAPDRTGAAVEEILRLASPNQFGNRSAAVDVEIAGMHISAGTNLHLCIGAANRDPAVFAEPDRFDLARHPNRHLAFAGGPHVCVGLALARMEGRVAIQRFLSRFPRFRLTRRSLGRRVRFRGYSSLIAELG